MSLTVACVWVNGHLPYPVEYVTRLHAMARRWITRPFAFVCLTDMPRKVPDGVVAVDIPNPNPLKGWWSKIRLFDPAHGLSGRMLYLDLDTLIVNSLDAVIDYPAEFALAPHAGTFNGKYGLQVVKRFNSSVMVWNAGTQDFLHRDFSPAVAEVLHGDQDYIGLVAIDAVAMPLSWFPRLSELNGQPPCGDAKVVLAKKPKNIDAAKQWPWFRKAWG